MGLAHSFDLSPNKIVIRQPTQYCTPYVQTRSRINLGSVSGVTTLTKKQVREELGMFSGRRRSSQFYMPPKYSRSSSPGSRRSLSSSHKRSLQQ